MTRLVRARYTIECATCHLIHPLDEYEAEHGKCPECGAEVLNRKSATTRNDIEEQLRQLVAVLDRKTRSAWQKPSAEKELVES